MSAARIEAAVARARAAATSGRAVAAAMRVHHRSAPGGAVMPRPGSRAEAYLNELRARRSLHAENESVRRFYRSAHALVAEARMWRAEGDIRMFRICLSSMRRARRLASLMRRGYSIYEIDMLGGVDRAFAKVCVRTDPKI